MARKKITAYERKDWRNLPLDQWNVVTIHAYFADMNRELFGVTEYLPMRNWRFEQGVIKRSLTEHGAELLKRAFDECFRAYKPSREYPLLTTGFAISYRINGIIPKLKAEMEREQQREQTDGTVNSGMTTEEMAAWL